MSIDLINATESFLSKISNLDGISQDIITNVVVPTIKTYQEKVNVGIQDSVSDLLDNFKQRIVETIIQTNSHWKLPKRDILLFPKNCRLCYQKGDSTIFVIEQEPQVRSLLMDKSILDKEYDETLDGEDQRIPLALPYVIFLMHFKKQELRYVYTCWRIRPLTSMDDMLCYPCLPNIQENLSICMALPNHSNLTLLEKIDITISDYWNTMFNSDLGNHWWTKDRRHPKLDSAKLWSEASLENPLFILEANFQSAKTIKSLLDAVFAHEDEIDESALLHLLTEKIDETTKLLFNKILNYLRKTNFAKYHPKSVSEQLAGVMREANADIANFSFVLENELKNLRQELEKEASGQKPMLGAAWMNYED